MNKIKGHFLIMAFILLTFQSCNSKKKTDELTNSKTIDSLKSTTTTIMDSLKVNHKEENTKMATSETILNDCKCDAVAYITKSPTAGIKLLDKEGNLVKTISFDAENEEFLKVFLQDYKNDLFHIKSLSNPFNANFNKDDSLSNLWIKSDLLEVFLPDRIGKVNVYSDANEKSEILNKVSTGQSYDLKLIKCCNNWIYGVYSDKSDNKVEGWFHPSDICSSPLTNC